MSAEPCLPSCDRIFHVPGCPNVAREPQNRLSRLPVRAETVANEITAIQEEIATRKACAEGDPSRMSAMDRARYFTLVGAEKALRWVSLGFDGELPMSVQIGVWRNEDELNKVRY